MKTTTTTATALLLAAVAGCGRPSVAGTTEEIGEVGREIVEAIAAGLGEDPSELRILAGSWDNLSWGNRGNPDLAAEIKAYAEASGIVLACPGGDPHYCWTDGRPWEEVHWGDPSNPRTMPQVLDFRVPFFGPPVGAVTFKYRYRQDDGSLQDLAPLYGLDVERLETGEWRIGELELVGGFLTW